MSVILNDGETMSQTVWNVETIEQDKQTCTIKLKPTWHKQEQNKEKRHFVKRVEMIIDIVDVTSGYKYLIQPAVDSVKIISSTSAQVLHQAGFSTYQNTKYIYTLEKEQELTEDTYLELRLSFSSLLRVNYVTAFVCYVTKNFHALDSIKTKIKQMERDQTECLKKLLECTSQLAWNTEKLSKANLELQECIEMEKDAEKKSAAEKLEQIKQVIAK